MYDVLVYLFENCQQAEHRRRSRARRAQAFRGRLRGFGHQRGAALAGRRAARAARAARSCPIARSSFRAFAPRELAKLDAECRGFLITLEQSGILTPADARARARALARGVGRMRCRSSSSS